MNKPRAAGVKKGIIKKRSPDCGSLDFLAGLTRSPPEIRAPQITLLNLPGNGSLETLKSNFGLPSARPAAVRAVGENIRTVGDSREWREIAARSGISKVKPAGRITVCDRPVLSNFNFPKGLLFYSLSPWLGWIFPGVPPRFRFPFKYILGVVFTVCLLFFSSSFFKNIYIYFLFFVLQIHADTHFAAASVWCCWPLSSSTGANCRFKWLPQGHRGGVCWGSSGCCSFIFHTSTSSRLSVPEISHRKYEE